MRGKNPQGGRFDTLFEVEGIYEGISEDLQQPVGQTVDWWVFDPVATTVDPVYDVGSAATSSTGRRWVAPLVIPVVGASIAKGGYQLEDRGLYTTDTLRLVVAMNVLDDALKDVYTNQDIHLKDRLVYRNEVFEPTTIFPKGHIHQHLAVVTVFANQINAEQLVNDAQFRAYAA